MVDHLPSEPEACRLCGMRSSRILLSGPTRSLLSDGRLWQRPLVKHECTSCGVVFGREDAFLLDAHYESAYVQGLVAESQSSDGTGRTKRLLDTVIALLEVTETSQLRLGEVGAGAGLLVESLTDLSGVSHACGVDLSTRAVQAALDRGVCVKWGGLEALPFELHAVIAIAVLEHVIDPRQFLVDCSTHLVAGGTLVLAVPGRTKLSHDFWIADHLWHFHVAHLRQLANQAGFGVGKVLQPATSDEFLFVVLHKADVSGPPVHTEASLADDLMAANRAELTGGIAVLDRTSAFLAADNSPVVIAGLGERFDFLRCYAMGLEDTLAQALLVDDNPARVEARLALECVPSADLGRFGGRARRGLTTFWNSNLANSTIDWFAPYAHRSETNETDFRV